MMSTIMSSAHADKVQMPDPKNNTPYLTNNAGEPVNNNDYSLTVGPRGPMLLEDQFMLEKLAQLNREKTPERTVHARGMTAKGYFEVTSDVSDLTCASFLGKKGKKTPVAARFSTVTHERGSPESLRDVRGFSVKFYTDEGNWDFVGNNIPVFFIRDGMKFPDLVHALRPNPKNHIQEGWRILDFLSHHPESAHILTWLLDEPGIPANWRALEGYGVNTYKLVNKAGEEKLVKFHWKPKGGAKFLTDEEATQVGEFNMRHSHATHDLVNAIAKGDYPEWTFYWQTMDPADQFNFDFDPLDCTKVWPEDIFPLQEVGRMVIDTNIDNFHNESEQIAFSPGRGVPGITFSDDKVLQSRTFAYADTQRYRIGVNYQMLPINMPKCPFHMNQNDGAMNFSQKDEEVNYWPSHAEPPLQATKTPKEAEVAHPYSSEKIEGVRVKADYGQHGGNDGKWDDFKQARDRLQSMDETRHQIFLEHVVDWMADPKLPVGARNAWHEIWKQVDESFAEEMWNHVKMANWTPRPMQAMTGRTPGLWTSKNAEEATQDAKASRGKGATVA